MGYSLLHAQRRSKFAFSFAHVLLAVMPPSTFLKREEAKQVLPSLFWSMQDPYVGWGPIVPDSVREATGCIHARRGVVVFSRFCPEVQPLYDDGITS